MLDEDKPKVARALRSRPHPLSDKRLKDVPLIYADKMAGVVFGFSTSRIVLANERTPSDDDPVVTVVMPTPALVTMALEILATTANEELIGEMEERYRSIVDMMRTVQRASIKR